MGTAELDSVRGDMKSASSVEVQAWTAKLKEQEERLTAERDDARNRLQEAEKAVANLHAKLEAAQLTHASLEDANARASTADTRIGELEAELELARSNLRHAENENMEIELA